MDDGDALAQFLTLTAASPDRARQYLTITDYNLEQAVQLYFESDGVDLGGSIEGATQRPSAHRTERGADGNEVTYIDSDDDLDAEGGTQSRRLNVEDDEAIARRMQEEMYGSAGPGQGMGEEQIRAPQPRQAQTLMDETHPMLGGGADWRNDPNELNAAVTEQLMNRERRRVTGRPGIFNQVGPEASIWEADGSDPEAHRRHLSRATGGASEASSKSNMLAEMFRPPFELISPLRTWDGVRADGKEREKWILINMQDPAIFDCQVLNRDIWKNPEIAETVKENFIFKQYSKNDAQADSYVRYYFQAKDNQDAYPHIAIVDPRTGEQVKVWSGSPAPKAMEFLQQLHEFLDRYSLKANARNPVATRKPKERQEVDVHRMTEEEMVEMAMQNSLDNKPTPTKEDPDNLTRDAEGSRKGKEKVSESTLADDVAGSSGLKTETQQSRNSPFSQISASEPHTEPAVGAANTTRIQFRHSGGRIVRRFALDDPVRRIYEWLKADAIEGKTGLEFELIYTGKNLIDVVGQSIEEAGLRNGSVMVEYLEG